MIYFISDILDFLPECRNFYFSPFYPLIFASSLRQKHKVTKMSKIRMKLTHVLPAQTGVSKENKPWKKQAFVFEDPDVMYPNVICATIFGEDKLARFTAREGDLVDVEFAFSAHEFNGHWYNEVRVRDFSLVTF